MAHNNYKTIFLKDYKPADYNIQFLELTFNLQEDKTLVKAKMHVERISSSSTKALCLHGEHVKLNAIVLDDKALLNEEFRVIENELLIYSVPQTFSLEIETEIKPQENTALTGLYKSNNIFCTQCEAEGFRRITYFLDRPGVLTHFTTTIIADKQRYPILLSNGNIEAQGDNGDGTHWVRWVDPFKKPAYLFALVAGDLECSETTFTTHSGRPVSLKVFVEKGDSDKSLYALEALQKAMRWDEETFGREYDLELYMIVAISDFNMGAMENKGLNIFNTKYVLANELLATDSDYEAILQVIGHEYFHNWTGNRITCRDWFQLSLKEGLTIFRDQEFTADMTSRTVKRIKDVRTLKTFQFAEDAGPMAHSVRPESYIEINNFYTHTVYEKGAEVIRMIQTLLGKQVFRHGMDLYFARHDGQAVTIEDFVKCFEDASNLDLTQFRRWYAQAGTPKLTIDSIYYPDTQEMQLIVMQSCDATPGQENKQPFYLPLVTSLLDEKGELQPIHLKEEARIDQDEVTLIIKEPKQTFTFTHLSKRPILSLLHNFSAPVQLAVNYSDDDLVMLIANDPNLYSRWEASQRFFFNEFNRLYNQYINCDELVLNQQFIFAFADNLRNENLDKASIAELFSLPSEKYIANTLEIVHIEALHHIQKFIRYELAKILKDDLLKCYQQNHNIQSYERSPAEIGKRQLKNVCLSYLMLLNEVSMDEIAYSQYQQSNNMTDRLAALQMLANSSSTYRRKCLDDFYVTWAREALAIDKWFSIQALADQAHVYEDIIALTQHPAFNPKNPNRLRALIAAFSSFNLFHFHRADGKGYQLLCDFVIQLNSINPQIAARLLEPIMGWRRFASPQRELMQQHLEKIQNTKDLSNDVYELVEKSLI